MSFLLAGARLAAPVQMGPMGRSGGCLAFAGATAKRKVVRLRRSGSGTRRGGGCGGRCGCCALGMPIVPGLRVVRCCGRRGRPGLRVAAAREVKRQRKFMCTVGCHLTGCHPSREHRHDEPVCIGGAAPVDLMADMSFLICFDSGPFRII